MPHSLRAKLSGLRYKGILEDKDYKRLCHALDLEKAEQEQKSGKWINDKNDIPICSQCGYIPQYDRAIDDYEYSNYCPSCGCRMVEPQESEEQTE